MTTIYDLKDLPKLNMITPAAAVQEEAPLKGIDVVRDIWRMVKDIHAVICPPQEIAAEPKKKRPRYRDQLVAHMQPGEVYVAEDFLSLVMELGAEKPSVHNIGT